MCNSDPELDGDNQLFDRPDALICSRDITVTCTSTEKAIYSGARRAPSTHHVASKNHPQMNHLEDSDRLEQCPDQVSVTDDIALDLPPGQHAVSCRGVASCCQRSCSIEQESQLHAKTSLARNRSVIVEPRRLLEYAGIAHCGQ